ncbi:AsmA family protein [Marinomonas sp. C2222]|uniref:AsmA family protein n=1 Tax=Marinomonas sargassi TaxID=2984494 RepID=A0ABT2YP59_9GAMM|nr:AsmA family protein [Marinomonas sargassi]MCV2401673.1 AsmA family protein [Marinomonas sargassi]
MVWIKRFSLLVAAVLAVLVILLAYVALLLNPNDFKDELTSIVRDKAKVELRFDGDIKWSFYPWLGLELDNLGMAIEGDSELLRFDRAEFGLALMPLLQQKIQVNKVKLVNLTADLSIDQEGKGNWQFAEQTSTAASSSEKSDEVESPILMGTTKSSTHQDDTAEFSLPDVKLELLQIENARINYRDLQTNQQVSVVMNAQVDDVEWDRIWPVTMDIALTQSDLQGKMPMNLEAQLNANLSVFPERQFFSMDSLVLTTKLQAHELPVETIESKLKIMKVDFDLPQENMSAEGISLSSLGINVDANLQAYQVLSSPSFTANIAVGEFSPRQVMESLSLPLPDMSSKSVLSKAQASLELNGNAQRLTLYPATVQFDETKVDAKAVLDLSPLRWDIRVEGENLNLDSYLPAEEEGKQTQSDATAESQPSANDEVAELFPVELVHSLNGYVELAFKNLRVKNLAIDTIQLVSTQSQGVVKVSPLMANLYEGNVEAKVNLDVRSNEPVIDIVPSINGIQIQPLLVDFMDMDKISGTTQLTGGLQASGNNIDALMSSLTGDLLVDIKEGALVGINLTKTVCEGISSVRNEEIDNSRFSDDTPFESMRFPANIVNGQVSTPGLTVRSAGVQVTGDGTVSLTESNLDYLARVGFSGSELDDACRVNDKVAALTFPIQCKGAFDDDPSSLCRPDLKGFAGLFANLAKAELKQKAEEEKVRLQAELDEKIAEEKARLKAQLEAKRQEEEEALKEKLKNKLKSLF